MVRSESAEWKGAKEYEMDGGEKMGRRERTR